MCADAAGVPELYPAVLCRVVLHHQVSAALEEVLAARKNVEQQVKSAQQAVRDAESAYKQKVGAR